MKLKLNLQKDPKHTELVSCVGWASTNELYSVSDDHQVLKWDYQKDETSSVVQLPKETYATDIHWFPTGMMGSKKHSSHSEQFVLSCTDGKFLLVSRIGRVEKAVEAHKGAALGARWSYDGTALLTYGEDGAVKVWSRTGMLRTILAQSGSPVYTASWSPDSDQVLYASGKTLVIKPLQPSSKPFQWKAHDGIVLAVDWNGTNNLVISGGEDRKYKVWDSFGRNIYSSFLHDSPIASLSWAPDGQLFAVGAFNTLRLCDKTGWSHSLEKPNTGTVLKTSWTFDSTHFACACGNGQVVFAQVAFRRLEWKNLEATVMDSNNITVKDILNDSKEHLEFHDRIIKASLAWGHLVVATPTQCYIYNSKNWTTPATVELHVSAVNLIKQTEKYFLIVDSVSGIQIISYDGRPISTVKLPGMRMDSLSHKTISTAGNTIAIRDKREEKVIHMFDYLTGKEITEATIHHHMEVTSLALSNCNPSEQLLAFVDRNEDLYLSQLKGYTVGTAKKPVSLGSMVSSICWSDQGSLLAGMQDGCFVVWCQPAIAYVDRDLIPLTTIKKQGSEFSKSPQLIQFVGNHCTLRRSDGILITTSVSPFPGMLHQLASAHKWEAAMRIVKEPMLWACLIACAASARDLETMETAYAAINEIDKVQLIREIRNLPSRERQSAELAMFCRQAHQAEAIYLQAGMVFRAIELHLRLFNWERALEIAVKHKTHVDTVLAFREKYLQEVGCKETIVKFNEYNKQITIDWEKVAAKVSAEEEKERT